MSYSNFYLDVVTVFVVSVFTDKTITVKGSRYLFNGPSMLAF